MTGFMKEKKRMGKGMATADGYRVMAVIMKESGKMVKNMGKERGWIQME